MKKIYLVQVRLQGGFFWAQEGKISDKKREKKYERRKKEKNLEKRNAVFFVVKFYVNTWNEQRIYLDIIEIIFVKYSESIVKLCLEYLESIGISIRP